MRRINALGYNGINAFDDVTFVPRRIRSRTPRGVLQPVRYRCHASYDRSQNARGRAVCPADRMLVHRCSSRNAGTGTRAALHMSRINGYCHHVNFDHAHLSALLGAQRLDVASSED